MIILDGRELSLAKSGSIETPNGTEEKHFMPFEKSLKVFSTSALRLVNHAEFTQCPLIQNSQPQ